MRKKTVYVEREAELEALRKAKQAKPPAPKERSSVRIKNAGKSKAVIYAPVIAAIALLGIGLSQPAAQKPLGMYFGALAENAGIASVAAAIILLIIILFFVFRRR